MMRAFHHDRRGVTIHFILAWIFFYGALHLGYLSYDTYKQSQRQDAELTVALERIGFYDDVLTLAAKSGAYEASGDWERQYDNWHKQLESSLHDVLILLPESDHAVRAVEAANTRLVAFERLAFAMSKQGQSRTAIALLGSTSYQAEKKRFSEAKLRLNEVLNTWIKHHRKDLRLKLWAYGAAILLMLALMWWMLYRGYGYLDRKLTQEKTKQQLAQRLLAPESAPLDDDIQWALELLVNSTSSDMVLLIRWTSEGGAHRWHWHPETLPHADDCLQQLGNLLVTQPLPADAVLDRKALHRHFTSLHASCDVLQRAAGILCVSSPIDSGRHSALVFIRIHAYKNWSEDDIAGIRSFAETLSRAIDKRDHEAQLYQLATTDSLTGLANHRHFIELLTLEMRRARRSKAPCALLMIDIDHFKLVNDTYGHEAGDDVLIHMTAGIRSALRGIDAFGRLGGEEFAAVLPGADTAMAMQVAERLRSGVQDGTIRTRAGDIRVTISIGVTLAGDDDSGADAILRRADNALYQAKHEGRNCIRSILP